MSSRTLKPITTEITDYSQVGKGQDKYVLEFTPGKGRSYFSPCSLLSLHACNGEFLAQQGSMFGADNTRLLYNGAYIMTTFEHQNRRVLTKNEIWDADNVHIEINIV